MRKNSQNQPTLFAGRLIANVALKGILILDFVRLESWWTNVEVIIHPFSPFLQLQKLNFLFLNDLLLCQGKCCLETIFFYFLFFVSSDSFLFKLLSHSAISFEQKSLRMYFICENFFFLLFLTPKSPNHQSPVLFVH